MSEEILKYQCCICKETVSSKQTTSHLDPCALVVVSNIDKPQNNQKEQQFFCHFECFRKTINNDDNLYIMDDDFPTMAEIG